MKMKRIKMKRNTECSQENVKHLHMFDAYDLLRSKWKIIHKVAYHRRTILRSELKSEEKKRGAKLNWNKRRRRGRKKKSTGTLADVKKSVGISLLLIWIYIFFSFFCFLSSLFCLFFLINIFLFRFRFHSVIFASFFISL